jgi:hypothetical protein
MIKRIIALIFLCLCLPVICSADGWFYSASGGTETIGYETVGSSSGNPSTGLIYISALDTPVNSGIFGVINIYISCSSATADLEVGIYAGTTPATAVPVGYKTFTDIGTLSGGWHSFSVLDQSWSATVGTSYWLGYCTNAGTSLTIWYDSANSGDTNYKSKTFGNAWPDPLGEVTALSTLRSMYATINH